ncbi:LPS-assembly protein LptD [Geoalkalibacter sp.]|uniref:LPS-assembly protein LptD n=1 Tax=Geoalkalibacter sp. TaxID=3041440 RepID=UPI00272EB6C4|nr:LPS assembly protein LptD [Geoalkalibacter sp.]
MSVLRLILSGLAAVLVAAAAGVAWGQASVEQQAPVRIEADQLSADRATGLYEARGNVRIEQGELTLLADEVKYNPATGDAWVPGPVTVSDAEGTLAGEDLEINLETGVGRLARGRFFLAERQLYVEGEQIERLSAQRYRLGVGSFTTCEGESPDWQFRARDLEVTLGGFARGSHARFYLKDLPLFYFPYFLYPAKTERESGLLMPRYGYSDRRGWELSLAYYQVIARNQDATLYLDYLTDLGLGKGVEYRYLFDAQEGEAKLYHVNGFNEEADAFLVEWRNDGQLPGEVRLGADVRYVSERDYFDRFGEVAGEYNLDKTESKIFLSRAWGKNNLGGQVKYLKDLYGTNDETLQRLPQVRFAASPRRFGETPLFYGFDGDYDYFWRQEGTKGQRLSLRPTLAAPFQVGGLLEISPEVAFRQRFYTVSGEEEDFSQKGQVEFTTRVSSALARVYGVAGRSVRRIQHVLAPEVAYEYIPQTDQERLPQFDAEDRIGPAHRLRYSLTNRLTALIQPADGAAFYHEFVYFRLSQDYDFRESAGDPLNPRDNLRPFSDVRAELLVRPTRWLSLDMDGRYALQMRDSKTSGFTDLRTALGINDGRGNGLSLGYHYLRDDLEYLDATLSTALLRPLYAQILYRHDLVTARTLETVYDLEYRSQCWSLFLTLHDRPEETRYLVSFALTGVGRVGKYGGVFGGAQ